MLCIQRKLNGVFLCNLSYIALVEAGFVTHFSTCTLGSCTPCLWTFLLVLFGQITLKVQWCCQASSSGLEGMELSADCFSEMATRQAVKFSLCCEILEQYHSGQVISHLQKDQIQMRA